MSASHQALLALPEMASLDDADRSKIRETFRETAVRGRVPLYREGDPAPGVHFLVSGFVKISRSSTEGKELMMALAGPGDVFGPCCDPFGTSPATCSAVTQGPARLLVMPAATFHKLTLAEPTIARPLMQLMLRGRRGCIELATHLAFRSVESRLANLLSSLIRWSPQGTTPVELPQLLTHAEMAHAVGTAREVVTRCLAHFEERGLIARRGRRILIPDPGALAAAHP